MQHRDVQMNSLRFYFTLVMSLISLSQLVTLVSIIKIFFQVKKTFRTSNWWEHHETWRDMRYDWLPSWNQIPKHLHEKTSRGHLEQLQVRQI